MLQNGGNWLKRKWVFEASLILLVVMSLSWPQEVTRAEESDKLLLSYRFVQGEKRAYRHTLRIAGESMGTSISIEFAIQYELEILQANTDGSAEIVVTFHPERISFKAGNLVGEVTDGEAPAGFESFQQFMRSTEGRELRAIVTPGGSVSGLSGHNEILRAIDELGEQNASRMKPFLSFLGISATCLPALPVNFPTVPIEWGAIWESQQPLFGTFPAYWRLSEYHGDDVRLQVWPDLRNEFGGDIRLNENGDIIVHDSGRNEQSIVLFNGWAIVNPRDSWDFRYCIQLIYNQRELMGFTGSNPDYRTIHVNLEVSLEPITAN